MRTLAFCLTLLSLSSLASCSPSQSAGSEPPQAPTSTTTPARAAHTKVTTFSFEGGRLLTPSPVLFESNSDKLTPEGEETLAIAKDFLDFKDAITVLRIEGHVYGGSESANQALSEKRALAAARWLVSQGVDCQRVLPVGFGSTKPLAAGGPPRIDFVAAALRGRPIGSAPLDGGGRPAGSLCP
jgi:OOP family OmpA-OmpF porin